MSISRSEPAPAAGFQVENWLRNCCAALEGERSGLNSTYGRALHAELDVIVAAQLAPVDALAVDEGAVPAALVDEVGRRRPRE